jgi:hypothetical protein
MKMAKAVSELIKLEIDLEVAKHYWDLDDVHADTDLAKKLVSDCAVYKNILDHFDQLSSKKFKISKNKTKRSLKIKRTENNEIATRISALTTAVNQNTVEVKTSLDAFVGDMTSNFAAAEATAIKHKRKITIAMDEARAATREARTATRDIGGIGDRVDVVLGS